MFSRMVGPLDMGKFAVNNMALQVLATAPSSPTTGQTYFDSALGSLQTWDGTAWTHKALTANNLNGQNAAFYLSRANHTGTQLSATISDLATTVQAYRLDQFALPTASLNANSQRIINVGTPSALTDAATMGYVQTQVSNSAAGIDSKPSVRAVATTNIALTGTQTIDGIALVANDRVLLTGQTTGTENGVYVVAAGAWARAVDADATGEITPGATWFVEEGTGNGASTWRTANTGTITIGTTVPSITKLTTSTSYTAGNGLQLIGSAFSVLTLANGGITSGPSGISVDRTLVPNRFAVTIGDGTNSVYTVTHNLNTLDVTVAVREISSGELVGVKVVCATVNTLTVTFGAVIAATTYRVTVIG